MVTRRVSEDEGRLFPHFRAIRAIRGFHVDLPKNTKLSAKVAWGPGPWSGAPVLHLTPIRIRLGKPTDSRQTEKQELDSNSVPTIACGSS